MTDTTRLIDEVTQAMFDANGGGKNGLPLSAYSGDMQAHLRRQAIAAIEICRKRKDEL